MKKAIIIGSGVAGLASAIRLANMGFKVDVFEKNPYVGGKLSIIKNNGYSFDAGPSLFTQPENIKELFTICGKKTEDYFTYQAMPLGCKYFFSDGKTLQAYSSPIAFSNEVDKVFGTGSKEITAYLADAKRMYLNIGDIFLNHSLHKPSTLLQKGIWKAITTFRLPHVFQSMDVWNKKRLTNPHLVQLFNRFATYNGSNPYQAPAMLTMIPHLEHNEGVFYPTGGMAYIPKALHALALDMGVSFHLNSRVDSIVIENKKAIGVQVDQVFYPSDVVLSNVDVYFTYTKLLGKKLPQKIAKQERSSSALIFYWGIKKEFPMLTLHNIIFTKDYQSEFNAIFKDKVFFPDPTVYINITSKVEPNTHSPSNCENWFVMINVPNGDYSTDIEWINKAKKGIINKINSALQTDIEPFIETEDVLTPNGIEQATSSYLGSLYGTSSNNLWAAFLRHTNFSNETKGLYFIGGSVHPGGGIPLCLKSAKITTEIISNDFKAQ